VGRLTLRPSASEDIGDFPQIVRLSAAQIEAIATYVTRSAGK
jgi:hypothetical protein